MTIKLYLVILVTQVLSAVLTFTATLGQIIFFTLYATLPNLYLLKYQNKSGLKDEDFNFWELTFIIALVQDISSVALFKQTKTNIHV